MDDGFASEIAKLKARWDRGIFSAAHDAVHYCAEHDKPLPKWTSDAAYAALKLAWENSGSGGRGKTGSYRKQEGRKAVDFIRWASASAVLEHRDLLLQLGKRATREGAFKHVSEQLAGTPAQGSPGAVKRSYEKLQSQNRPR